MVFPLPTSFNGHFNIVCTLVNLDPMSSYEVQCELVVLHLLTKLSFVMKFCGSKYAS